MAPPNQIIGGAMAPLAPPIAPPMVTITVCQVRAKTRPAYLTTLAYLLYYRLLNLSICDSRSIFRYYVREFSRRWLNAETACKSGKV